MNLRQSNIYIYLDDATDEIEVSYIGQVEYSKRSEYFRINKTEIGYAFESTHMHFRDTGNVTHLILTKDEVRKQIFEESANQILNSFE